MSFLMVQICRNKEFRYINQYRGGGISYKREGINIQIVCSGANKQFKRNPLSVSPHPRLVLLSLKPGFLKKKKKRIKRQRYASRVGQVLSSAVDVPYIAKMQLHSIVQGASA